MTTKELKDKWQQNPRETIFFYLFFITFLTVLLSVYSCNIHKHKYIVPSFQKVQNGIYPKGVCMVIVTEECDTLYLRSSEQRMYGRFQEKHTGQYFVVSNWFDKIHFRCNIADGALVGDYVHYSHYRDSVMVLSRGYLANGRWVGYQIDYSNGMVKCIQIYNPCNHEKGGIWMYFDESGELLKAEDYGIIPDSCLVPNQYLFDSLPEKYRTQKPK